MGDWLLAGKERLTTLCVAVSPPQQPVFPHGILCSEPMGCKVRNQGQATSCQVFTPQDRLVFLATNAQEVGAPGSENHL